MNEKDENLQSLFDGFADELEPRTDLAQNARERMNARRSVQKHSSRKHSFAKIFTGVAVAAAVAVFAFTVIPDLINTDDRRGGAHSPPDSGDISTSKTYEIEDVRAQAVTRADVREYMDVSNIEKMGYEVYAENYYACYFKSDGKLAYFKALFGVNNGNGNIEISVIAEPNGHIRKDLNEDFRSLMSLGDTYAYTKSYKDGEYITAALIHHEKMHYFVNTIGNADGAIQIIRNFL